MAINDFLNAALREAAMQNFPVATACICCVVDSLGKIEFGGSTKRRSLAFINKYLDIISLVGFGGAILAAPGSKLNILDPINPSKTKDIRDVIYTVLRCSLIHEASLPFNVELTKESFYGLRGGRFIVPTNFFYAMLFAAIASPGIVEEREPENAEIQWNGRRMNLHELLGKAWSVRELLGISDSMTTSADEPRMAKDISGFGTA